jgi:hypothetical protein
MIPLPETTDGSIDNMLYGPVFPVQDNATIVTVHAAKIDIFGG